MLVLKQVETIVSLHDRADSIRASAEQLSLDLGEFTDSTLSAAKIRHLF